MQNTFPKSEKLKSKKLIEGLFARGKHLKSFPVQLVYLEVDHAAEFPVQAGFSVSKKKFKRAVDRNRIKRLMREAYRLNKQIMTSLDTKKHVFMFIYIGKEKTTYQEVERSIQKLLNTFLDVSK